MAIDYSHDWSTRQQLHQPAQLFDQWNPCRRLRNRRETLRPSPRNPGRTCRGLVYTSTGSADDPSKPRPTAGGHALHPGTSGTVVPAARIGRCYRRRHRRCYEYLGFLVIPSRIARSRHRCYRRRCLGYHGYRNDPRSPSPSSEITRRSPRLRTKEAGR